MRPLLPHEKTHILIDGFPRSANSYTFYGLRHLLGSDAVSGHTHSANVIIASVRAQIPTAIVVRNPDSVVNSLCRYIDGLSPRIAYWAYTRFHRPLMRHLSRMTIIDFERLTTAPEETVGQLLRNFSIEARPFDEEIQAETKKAVALANDRFNPDRPERLALPKRFETNASFTDAKGRDAALSVYRSFSKCAL